jgi:hypothetical protein
MLIAHLKSDTLILQPFASWFETRGFAALLTMRLQEDLILEEARKRRLEG